MRNRNFTPISSELTTESHTIIDNDGTRHFPELPQVIRDYMNGNSTAQPGSREWYQEAFQAVADCATHNGEFLTEQFFHTYATDVGDDEDDEVCETVEEMIRRAGLERLC